jgi:TM2 domain-containing membrane protein YozV
MKYFYADAAHRPAGPVEFDDLRRLYVAGLIRTDTYVIEEHGAAWQPLSAFLVPELPPLPPPPIPGAPPPVPAVPAWVTGRPVERKSKLAGGLLGIFLGWLGVHNFYLGYYGRGVAQLLLSLCCCFVLSPLVSIWGLIEGILILTGSISTDGNGVPLRD